MQETQVRSLGQKDPLEEERATHSCFLVWKIPWTEKPDALQSMGSQKSLTWLSESTATTNIDVLFICAFGNVGDFTEGLRRRQMNILEMWPQVECYHLHFFFFYFASTRGMQDPSSLTRHWTRARCSGSSESQWLDWQESSKASPFLKYAGGTPA